MNIDCKRPNFIPLSYCIIYFYFIGLTYSLQTQQQPPPSSFIQPSSFTTPPHNQIDLIKKLQQTFNYSYQGLQFVTETLHHSPTIDLTGDLRLVKLPDQISQQAVELLAQSEEITFLATIKQNVKNTGALISLSSDKNDLLWEIQSSGRRDEIRLLYKLNGSLQSLVFPFHLADNSWHRIAIVISGSHVDLYVDCVRIERKRLFTSPSSLQHLPFSSLMPQAAINSETVSQKEDVHLWIGQRKERLFLLKGYLRDVKIISGPHGYLSQCPHLDTECPTCGQFKSLKHIVHQLQDYVKDLMAKVKEQEKRLSSLEECQCLKHCQVNGTTQNDGSSWTQGCDICTCEKGMITCKPIECTNCTGAVSKLDPLSSCCPQCGRTCFKDGVTYKHGQEFVLKALRGKPESCQRCKCDNGSNKCMKLKCPKLNCPIDKRLKRLDGCCYVCSDQDFCAEGHNCHSNATCHNAKTEYICKCNSGFTGNGHHCQDINECLSHGGLGGHLCPENTTCVNTLGSYECNCSSGYEKRDSRFCLDIDECSSPNMNKCHLNAKCINTQGGHTCECLPGFKGDGIDCEPVCEHKCQNGGRCTAPDTCSCRRGFTGQFCEKDIDECSLGIHQCHPNSKCINKPGWYVCECLPGYRNRRDDLEDNHSSQLQCIDIDECDEGIHDCNSGSDCVNTEGSFRCECPDHGSGVCEYNSCYDNGKEYAHGYAWNRTDTCETCNCHRGAARCASKECSCNDIDVDLNCCPQCDPRGVCVHQENTSKTFTNGQTWLYQCQMCECLFGEIDCWDYECLPTSCTNPVKIDGECCPRCGDDPCESSPPQFITPGISSTSNALLLSTLANNSGCMYNSESYREGERIPIESDPCASCKCKVPVNERSVSNRGFECYRVDVYAVLIILLVSMIVRITISP
ncbi:protein kinase C-binding protein NELL1-like isoform X2 [Brevipalpus obovatus]|uniref:protein kinase C-binding protein NELL1-like isoform X2 n=1 Tax=Brevipalpus obovatus TaxID=246614 RepID=UPI003D9E4E9B